MHAVVIVCTSVVIVCTSVVIVCTSVSVYTHELIEPATHCKECWKKSQAPALTHTHTLKITT